jgi:hypothetical protein
MPGQWGRVEAPVESKSCPFCPRVTDWKSVLRQLAWCEAQPYSHFTDPLSSPTTEFTSVEQRFCTTLLAFLGLVQKSFSTETKFGGEASMVGREW